MHKFIMYMIWHSGLKSFFCNRHLTPYDLRLNSKYHASAKMTSKKCHTDTALEIFFVHKKVKLTPKMEVLWGLPDNGQPGLSNH
ncbi:MAG: hypothetical protein U9R17_08645, partial [Thermodesulfobacteriota bacterium]|nr:hypothetical protein [Thermodesulfobacteriota bacterium]